MAIAVVATSLLTLLVVVLVMRRRRKFGHGETTDDVLNTPQKRLLVGGALGLVLAAIALIAVAALTETREQTRGQAADHAQPSSARIEGHGPAMGYGTSMPFCTAGRSPTRSSHATTRSSSVSMGSFNWSAIASQL